MNFGKTGTTFHFSKDFLAASWPAMRVIENVKEVANKKDSKNTSDLDFVMEELRSLGCCVIVQMCELPASASVLACHEPTPRPGP